MCNYVHVCANVISVVVLTYQIHVSAPIPFILHGRLRHDARADLVN